MPATCWPEAGVATWLPAADAVTRCLDKWRFRAAVTAAGIAAPATGLGTADGVPGPWIVKPRFGRGSGDVYAVDEEDELAWALRRVPAPIVQTRLAGREFTVDALVDRDGRLAGAVPRWRIETKAGISTKGTTFADDRLVAGVGALTRTLGLTGPCNVQGFVAPDGSRWFVEVNPRFSGGLALSLAAGAELVAEYLHGMFGQPCGLTDCGTGRGSACSVTSRRSSNMRVTVPLGTRPEIVKLAPVVRHCGAGRTSTGRRDRSAPRRIADGHVLRRPRAASRRAVVSPATSRSVWPASWRRCCGNWPTVPRSVPHPRRHLHGAAGVPGGPTAPHPVAHVEAGLRSFNATSMEEMDRRVAAATASLHFAPTELAARFLQDEGVARRAHPRRREPGCGRASRQGRPRSSPPGAGHVMTAHRSTNVDDRERLASS